MLTRNRSSPAAILAVVSLFVLMSPATYALLTHPMLYGSPALATAKTITFDSAAATRGTGLNPDPVSVSLSVRARELLIAGLTYSTAGSVSPSNGIAAISDKQGLTWKHILNSGITGGEKAVDIYYAVAASGGKDSLTITPISTTYKTGFVSSWGTTATAVDVAHAVSTCDPGFASSVTATLTTSSQATIGTFSADDGQINSGIGSGTFHFDFYNGGPNGVSVNIDDVIVSSSGTFTDTWSWSGSTTACTVAVPIVTKLVPVPAGQFDMAAATRGTGLNPDPVSVPLSVKTGELLMAGLTYSTAGNVSPNNGVGSIIDSQALTWTHVLNSGITGGEKGVDVYYAIAASTDTDTVTLTPASTTYKTGFLSSWGINATIVDTGHAVATCDPGFASSITTTVTTSSPATIGAFSADDGQISSSSGPGAFHFDFYNGGPNGVSINLDDVAVGSAGTFNQTWYWSSATTACIVAVPISNHPIISVGTNFVSAGASGGTGLNPSPVSVSLQVKAGQLLMAGLTYSTAGGANPSNGIAVIQDGQNLTWTHVLNSGITGGEKGVDVYYAIAASNGNETVTLTPASTTYKSGFVSAWSASAVDLTDAVATCDPGFASSISTTVTTAGNMTIAAFSADDGQINSGTGPGSFHFDFYNTGPNHVSVNVDDVVVASSGTFTYSWYWSGSTTACTVAVPIGMKGSTILPTPFNMAAATGGTGLNPDPVFVSLPVTAGQVLIAGLTYSTAGSVSPNNGVASITDTEGLTWIHILNSTITGGNKGIDTYYSIATTTGTDTLTITPISTTYKSGFVSSWSASTVDVSHAVATCDASFSTSITTTVTTSGPATIGAFSADDGQINGGIGAGSFHFDFYNTGPNHVSVNLDDVVVSSAGTYTDTWSWIGSTTACTVAVSIS